MCIERDIDAHIDEKVQMYSFLPKLNMQFLSRYKSEGGGGAVRADFNSFTDL